MTGGGRRWGYWIFTTLGLWMFALGWVMAFLSGGGFPWGVILAAIVWSCVGVWVTRGRR